MSDPYQQAFQEYMIGKISAPTTTPETSPSKSSPSKKRFGSVLKAFQGRLQEWMDANVHLGDVMGSIANLRDRIYWESQQQQQKRGPKNPEWQSHAFRQSRNTCLLVEDVEMALTADLLQHERMLSAARNLISSLSQTLDALGRRLDEWIMMELTLEPSFISVQGEVMDQCQQIYTLLAQELYRKQLLVHKVLDSCNDSILAGGDDDVEGMYEGENPRSVARKCVVAWSAPDRKELWILVDELLAL
jgi:hypothetical protein